MATFDECIEFGKQKLNINYELKSEQVDTVKNIFNGHDTVSILPTGFGKSIIFQLLPFVMAKKNGMKEPMIVLVVTPINSIMEEQVRTLRGKGIMACYLASSGSCGMTYGDDDIDEDDMDISGEDEQVVFSQQVTIGDLYDGKYHIIYSHPECLFKNKFISMMLRSNLYMDRLCCIVVDEVHMVIEWGKEFRPHFQRLGELTCLRPNIGHLALTATAKPEDVKKLAHFLMFENYHLIQRNPDRQNIFLKIEQRPSNNNKIEKYNHFIKPLAIELMQKMDSFPLTVVYVENLEALGYCYRYLDYTLKDKQFNHKIKIPENRIFAQYHADYTVDMKKSIVLELGKDKPLIRLVLATVALGMGLNAPSISRVYHMRPPNCLENYIQEIGRAGRMGQQSTAVMFFNNNDISASRKGMTPEMIAFCRNTDSCLRKQLTQYFGFHDVLFNGEKNDCCINCRVSS